MKVKKEDHVKHKNVFIEGEIIQIDKPELKGQKPIIHVQCDGGTYYDSSDNWELVKK
jgi:hypothetical protein